MWRVARFLPARRCSDAARVQRVPAALQTTLQPCIMADDGINTRHLRYPDHSSVRSQISMRVREVTRATGPQPPSMWSPQRACKASSIDVNQN